MIRAVKECEKAGAAGLFIEGQTYPKRCGHMEGKGVVSVEEYLPKLKTALWAREDRDFVIMARTDARAVYGIEEALKRAAAHAYIETRRSTELHRVHRRAPRLSHVVSFCGILDAANGQRGQSDCKICSR